MNSTCFLQFLLFVPYQQYILRWISSRKSTSTVYHQKMAQPPGCRNDGTGHLKPSFSLHEFFIHQSVRQHGNCSDKKFHNLRTSNCLFLVGGEDEDIMTLLKTAAVGYLTNNRTCRNLTTSSHPEEKVQRKMCGTGINGKTHYLQKKLFKLSAWIWDLHGWHEIDSACGCSLSWFRISSHLRSFNWTLMATQPAFASSAFFTTGHTLLQTGFPNALQVGDCQYYRDFQLICAIQRRHPEWTLLHPELSHYILTEISFGQLPFLFQFLVGKSFS